MTPKYVIEARERDGESEWQILHHCDTPEHAVSILKKVWSPFPVREIARGGIWLAGDGYHIWRARPERK